jgi:hypothetical protein
MELGEMLFLVYHPIAIANDSEVVVKAIGMDQRISHSHSMWLHWMHSSIVEIPDFTVQIVNWFHDNNESILPKMINYAWIYLTVTAALLYHGYGISAILGQFVAHALVFWLIPQWLCGYQAMHFKDYSLLYLDSVAPTIMNLPWKITFSSENPLKFA